MEYEKNFDRKRENFRVSKASELGCLPASVSVGLPEGWKVRSGLKEAGPFGRILSRFV